jgi:transcriptional regulator with XRE-family HTH domain
MIERIRKSLRREMDRTGLRGKKLAKAAGLHESAIRDLLHNVNDPKIGTLAKVAKALGIHPCLLFDDLVPVKGLIGVGGIVRLFDDDAVTDFAPRPPSAFDDLIALRVVGEMLRPAHRDGDILFVRETRQIDLNSVGHEVLAQLLDGSAYLRTLASGTKPGLHTLRHWTGSDAENVTLAWASPVLFTIRGAALNGD